MEGTRCDIRSSADLKSVEYAILDLLCYGVDIHILGFSHRECENSDITSFNNFINNREQDRKVMFITENSYGK